MATMAAPSNDKLPLFNILTLHLSPTNPRHVFDAAADEELLASVRQDGVLSPLLLRPSPQHLGQWEVVYGERRWRAAKKAGLTQVPAFVRTDLSDADVARLQLVENSKRADLHPLDEAAGYRALQEQHGLTVAQIADEVGKKPGLIKQRLVLCTLPPGARKLFAEGALKLAVATLIASAIRTPAMQEQAAKELATVDAWTKEPVGYRRALEQVTRRYLLRLKDAPFKADDASLVPVAGRCTDCPKRTGNQRELFGDVEGDDLCTDQACFEAKGEASWTRATKAAAEKNLRVLSPKEAKSAFSQYNLGELDEKAGYVDSEGKTAGYGPAKTWKALLGKSAPPPVIAQDPRGRERQLYAKQDVAKALKALGKTPMVERASSRGSAPQRSDKERAEETRQRKDESFRKQGIRAAMARIAEQAEKREPNDAFWLCLTESMLGGSWHDTIKEVVARRGWEEKKMRPEDLCRRHMKDLGPGSLRALALEIAVTRGAFWDGGGNSAAPFKAACTMYGVDPKTLEKAARAAAVEPKKPAASSKRTKAAR